MVQVGKEGWNREVYQGIAGYEGVRFMFRLTMGSIGLFLDKRRYSDNMCMMCDSGEVEDVGHF